MTRHCKAVAVFLSLGMSLLLPSVSLAQIKAMAAPVPAQILTAKKVFIGNAGGDQMAENDPIFSGGPARAYDQFYAAMKAWGRFEMVGAPADADLLLEIRQEVWAVSLGGKAGSSYTPLFHLEVRDPKTNALLYGFHVHSQFALGQGSSDRNFDQAVNRLVTDLRELVAQSPVTDSPTRP